MSKPFKSLYGDPPSDDDDNDEDDVLDDSLLATRRYDRDMQHLRCSSWFTDRIQKVLANKVWPTDDKADETLPIASVSHDTANQVLIKTSQLQTTHSVWENSKGLSRGSKRAASPTPEPSSKRHRGTPATPESHT